MRGRPVLTEVSEIIKLTLNEVLIGNKTKRFLEFGSLLRRGHVDGLVGTCI